MDKLTEIPDQLKKLGFKRAIEKIDKGKRMEFAYSNYLFVTQDKIDLFNKNLRKETLKESPGSYEFKKLAMIPIGDYDQVPPKDVLDAIEKAQKDACFHTFEIAKIEWIKQVKDPIVFGRIQGCTDYFFISQWDDDVQIEDIMFMEGK